jgi:hypothetical protein
MTAAASHPTAAASQPPVVTYPEFLTVRSRPALTAKRLMVMLYLFGGLSAVLYGTSTYLIAPLIAQLTHARHQLALTAQQNLERLAARLKGFVSIIPPKVSAGACEGTGSNESEDGDPTEVFHRDVGVQTGMISDGVEPLTLDKQAARLNSLHGTLRSLNQVNLDADDATTSMTTSLTRLTAYLDGLCYDVPSYKFGNQVLDFDRAASRSGATDCVAGLKREIRSMKGVLLSSRAFPRPTAINGEGHKYSVGMS